MSHYLYKLVPPRPSFALDMSESEAAVMAEHAVHWTGLMAQGHVIAFGPVIEPEASWGLAVVAAPDESTVRAFGEADPAVVSGVATFDVFAMPATVVNA